MSVLEVSDHLANTDLRTGPATVAELTTGASVLCGNWAAGAGHYMIGLAGFSAQTGRYQNTEREERRPLNGAESKHSH